MRLRVKDFYTQMGVSNDRLAITQLGVVTHILPRTRQRRDFGPANLAIKLRQVRHGLGLSQSEMVSRLDPDEIMHYGRISEYERGKRVPSLWVLLAYARVACIHLEDLVDDQIDLPGKLPGDVIYPSRAVSSESSS